MLDAIVGDGEGIDPMTLAVIAIVIAALAFGGSVGGSGCSDCRVDGTIQTTR